MVDASALEKASKVDVFDSKGSTINFGTIFASQKVVIVFTRHFFCGKCQAYIQQLAAVPAEALGNAQVEIVVIGCGDWQAISHYAERTGFSGKIYAEPTRVLYRSLGMDIETLATTPADQERPSYLAATGSRLKNALVSTWEGPLKHPSLLGKQGAISQLGGDFVFGPGNRCSFSHIMQHTEDHVEIQELMKHAGVTY
ncbi:hypothetical protein E1B28_006389 [Marasmius oreades]|uniref:Uncharacterized protein n=1 Tax=Marasmius oreades TaxID=181124 RepID=A0A9P7UV81_9AGAR|nr:uncharacterized protein E1B28_006389 [Marasmius oreades]KAG7095672.1 hypothetical protein E1B28_006389 [Marasmius oreades]